MTEVSFSSDFLFFLFGYALLVGLIGVLMMIAGLIGLISVARMIREDRNCAECTPKKAGASHD